MKNTQFRRGRVLGYTRGFDYRVYLFKNKKERKTLIKRSKSRFVR